MQRHSLLIISQLTLIATLPAQAIEPQPDPTPLDQITSVSQLSDIKPTDWAFQSLQSLIERYGCIAGYPDKTYRGNRALTRYEFAAGLNSCLDRIQELITSATSDLVKKEDLAKLAKLQTEFATELASLQGQLNALETKTKTLEQQQFSTTTKLQGQTTFAINSSSAQNTNTTFIHRSRLTLATSFTGKDLLLTQLQAGTPNADAASLFQQENTGNFKTRLVTIAEAQIQTQFERIFFPLSTLGVTLEDLGIGLQNLPTVDAVQEKALGTIATFNLEEGLSPDLTLAIRKSLSDNLDTARTINRFLQTNSSLDYVNNLTTGLSLNRLSYQFPLGKTLQIALFPQGYLSDHIDQNPHSQNLSTYGLLNNQLLLANDTPGAGAALHWTPTPWLNLNLAYRAEPLSNLNTAVFTKPTDRPGLFNNPNLRVLELALTPTKPLILKLQYSNGTQGSEKYSVLGGNLQLALGKRIGIFGRFGYALDFPGNINPIGWSTGLALTDLLKPGAQAGLSIGQPLIFKDALGLFTGTQTNYEAFYHYPITNNINISPTLQVVVAPGNAIGDTIVTGTLRTTFTF
jgi:hypothetical protein